MIHTSRLRPHERRAEREAGADAERAEHAGVEPGSGPRGRSDVGRGRDEVAAVGDEHRVVARGAVERAEEARSG